MIVVEARRAAARGGGRRAPSSAAVEGRRRSRSRRGHTPRAPRARPGEVRDGAHNPAGVRWLVEHLPPDDYTVMASILADKDVEGMLSGLRWARPAVRGDSSSARARCRGRAGAARRRWFGRVEARDDPREALALAHALGEPRPRDRVAVSPGRSRGHRGGVVTGWRRTADGAGRSPPSFSLAIVGPAFAVGYILGKLLL